MNKSKCPVEGCPRKIDKEGLCIPHREERNKERGIECGFVECDRGATKAGLCNSHYSQKKNGKELTPLQKRRPVQYGPAECGTRRAYELGCRCAECREAKRVDAAEWRDRYQREHGRGYYEGRERNRTTYDRVCEYCGAEYRTRTYIAWYCSSTCGVQHRTHTPGYFGEGHCPTCGGTFTKTGVSHKYCTPDCRPTTKPKRTTPYVPEDMRSPLRKGYEDNNKTMFFAALKADCNVNEATNCWEWKRRTKSGYPTVNWKKKTISLHRASLEMSEGKPLGVLAAHHKCANTTCVNPEHLEPATAADNNLEMIARNSFIARIAELENVLRELNPGHEVLNRIAAT